MLVTAPALPPEGGAVLTPWPPSGGHTSTVWRSSGLVLAGELLLNPPHLSWSSSNVPYSWQPPARPPGVSGWPPVAPISLRCGDRAPLPVPHQARSPWGRIKSARSAWVLGAQRRPTQAWPTGLRKCVINKWSIRWPLGHRGQFSLITEVLALHRLGPRDLPPSLRPGSGSLCTSSDPFFFFFTFSCLSWAQALSKPVESGVTTQKSGRRWPYPQGALVWSGDSSRPRHAQQRWGRWPGQCGSPGKAQEQRYPECKPQVWFLTSSGTTFLLVESRTEWTKLILIIYLYNLIHPQYSVFNIYLFIYLLFYLFWLPQVLVVAHGIFLVVACRQLNILITTCIQYLKIFLIKKFLNN